MWTLLRYLSQTVVGSREPKLSRGEPHLAVPLEFTLGAFCSKGKAGRCAGCRNSGGFVPLECRRGWEGRGDDTGDSVGSGYPRPAVHSEEFRLSSRHRLLLQKCDHRSA